MTQAKPDRAAITGGKLGIFPATTAMPDRADGVDNMFRSEPVSAGNLGIAGLAAAKHATFVEQLRSRRPVDGTIDAATAQERRIGGVDDSVNAQGRNVSDDDFESLLKAQAEAAAWTATPLSAKSCCNSPAWNISRMMSQPPTNSPLT
jgi:hypothetical protein